jgi:hypothetical protein
MEPIEHRRLNSAQAAAYLGLGVSTIVKLRVFGEGPVFHKLGRRVVYDRRDLDSWLIDRRRTSTSDVGRAA